MREIVLLSVLAASIAIPMVTSRDPSAERGFRKTLLYYLLWNIFFLFALRFIYPRL